MGRAAWAVPGLVLVALLAACNDRREARHEDTDETLFHPKRTRRPPIELAPEVEGDDDGNLADEVRDLRRRVSALERRSGVEPSPAPANGIDARLRSLSDRLDSLHRDLQALASERAASRGESTARSDTGADPRSRLDDILKNLDELSDRVAAMRGSSAGARSSAPAPQGSGGSGGADRGERLNKLRGEIDQLESELDSLRSSRR